VRFPTEPCNPTSELEPYSVRPIIAACTTTSTGTVHATTATVRDASDLMGSSSHFDDSYLSGLPA
jgi:hypothetical protein